MLLTYEPRSVESISLASAKTSKADSSVTKAKPPVAFDKLYWLRIGFAVLGGISAQVFVGADYFTGISIGIAFYLLSFYIARFTWYKGSDRQVQSKVYSTGYGGYILVFVFTYMLLFTLQAVGYFV